MYNLKVKTYEKNSVLVISLIYSACYPNCKRRISIFRCHCRKLEKYESQHPHTKASRCHHHPCGRLQIRTRHQYILLGQKRLCLDIINMDGPTAELEYHNLKQMVNGKWLGFPFIDNLVFAIGGRDLSKGDTLPEHIRMSRV